MDDPEGLEVVDWGNPPAGGVHHNQPATTCRIRFRSKNPFGAKELRDADAVIQGGKVVEWHFGQGETLEPRYVDPVN